MCTIASVGASSARATVQPTRQPIIRCSSETEPTVTVRSLIASRPDGTTIGRPAKTIASQSIQ
jgi:hypothetical protein